MLFTALLCFVVASPHPLRGGNPPTPLWGAGGPLLPFAGRANPLYPGGGASRTPLHQLRGTITPNGLHFERHHAGVPDVDPTQHTLVINGLVAQPLAFDYESLLRYPMVSRTQFLECSGNSGALFRDTAV